jgi:hypothetical protein
VVGILILAVAAVAARSVMSRSTQRDRIAPPDEVGRGECGVVGAIFAEHFVGGDSPRTRGKARALFGGTEGSL